MMDEGVHWVDVRGASRLYWTQPSSPEKSFLRHWDGSTRLMEQHSALCFHHMLLHLYQVLALPPRDSDLIEATFGHGEANYLHTKEDLRSEFRRGSGANWDAAPAQCAAYHRLAEIGAQQWNSGMLTEAPEARAGQSASTSYNYTAGICHGTEQRRWRCNAICFN